VAQPVSNHLGLVSNSESMFILRDADYDPDVTPSGAIEDSIGQVAGTNGRLIVVQTIRAIVRVEVGVESWHQKPQLDDTPWESQRELALHSHSGVISVGQLYSAPPAELANIPLSAGPGDYAVQVNMRGRERLGRLITELLSRSTASASGQMISRTSGRRCMRSPATSGTGPCRSRRCGPRQ
jgi:hypothetical protein